MMWKDVLNSLYDEIMKESEKKSMTLEYKFYEKNVAPKWLEGDYDLHIEGNRMVMTSKDGKKVETRCHPEDDWRLQIGIDELKERMSEAKKPREIRVGDTVIVLSSHRYAPELLTDFFTSCNIDMRDVIDVVRASERGFVPSSSNECTVKYIGYYSDTTRGKQEKVALIQSNVSKRKYVTKYNNLMLVSK